MFTEMKGVIYTCFGLVLDKKWGISLHHFNYNERKI